MQQVLRFVDMWCTQCEQLLWLEANLIHHRIQWHKCQLSVTILFLLFSLIILINSKRVISFPCESLLNVAQLPFLLVLTNNFRFYFFLPRGRKMFSMFHRTQKVLRSHHPIFWPCKGMTVHHSAQWGNWGHRGKPLGYKAFRFYFKSGVHLTMLGQSWL